MLNNTKRVESWRRKGARGSREHVFGDELVEETMGVAREQEGRGDARSPQVQDEVFGQLGREDGFRCAQARCHCRNTEGDGGAWLDYCGAVGRKKDLKGTASLEPCER